MVRFLGLDLRRAKDKTGTIARAKSNLQKYGYTVLKNEEVTEQINQKPNSLTDFRGASKTLKEIVELKQMMAVVFPEQAQQVRNSRKDYDDDDLGFSMKDLPALLNALPQALQTLQQINNLKQQKPQITPQNQNIAPVPTPEPQPELRYFDVPVEDEENEDIPNVSIENDFIIIHKSIIKQEIENAPSLAKAFLGRMGVDFKDLDNSINLFIENLAKKHEINKETE